MIKFNLESDSVSGGFGISPERSKELIDKFFEQVGEWREANGEVTTSYLLQRVLKIAETEEEEAFIAYSFGKYTQQVFGNDGSSPIEALVKVLTIKG